MRLVSTQPEGTSGKFPLYQQAMAPAEMGKFGFAKLGDTNYGTWKVHMRGLLATKDCEAALATADNQHSSKAKGLMIMCVEEQHLQTIGDAANAKAAWEALANLYQQTSTANLLQLKKQLAGLVKQPAETITQYLARARAITGQMHAATGREVDTTDVVLAILGGLPSEYSIIRTVIENTVPLPSLAEMQAKLLLVEKQQSSAEGDSAYYTRVHTARQPNKTFSKQQGSPKTCWYCDKKGHIRSECRKRIRDEAAAAKKSSGSHSEVGMAAFDVSKLSNSDWVLDSGASRHITGNKEQLIKSRSAGDLTITFGNGGQGKATAVGDVVLMEQCASGDKLVLHNVLHVPEAKTANLLSISAAQQAGATFVFNSKGCMVYKGSKLLLKAQQQGGLYIIKGQPPSQPETAMFAKARKETAQDWHQRFAHLGYDSLARMVKQDMVKGINVRPEEFTAANKEVCEHCTIAKQTRLPFHSSDTVMNCPLALVHSDVCGPIKEQTLGGKRYLATFLDDYTGLSAIKLLAHKSEIATVMKEIFAELETQSGHQVKALRTDNGSEYVNSAVSSFLKSKGIVHQTTMTYTPQQNGKAERLNRTLMEKVRAMLSDAGLNKSLWGEAVYTANTLRNRSPAAGKDKTPWELFFNSKPDVSFLRPFGSTAYVLIPKEKRSSKLDSVSNSGKLVGYAPGLNGYRVLVSSNKVITSRDVIFSSPTASSSNPSSAAQTQGSSAPDMPALSNHASDDEDDEETISSGSPDDDDNHNDHQDGSNDDAGNDPPATPVPRRQSTRVTAGKVNPNRYTGSAQYPGYDRMQIPAAAGGSSGNATVMLAAVEELAGINKVKAKVMTSFEARDLGEAKHYLGIKITRDRGSRTIKLSQELMTTELVAKYGLSDGKVKNVPLSPSIRLSTEEGEPIDQGKYPYSQLVGSLLYLAVTTRPDIGFAVGVLARHMSCPTSSMPESSGKRERLRRRS